MVWLWRDSLGNECNDISVPTKYMSNTFYKYANKILTGVMILVYGYIPTCKKNKQKMYLFLDFAILVSCVKPSRNRVAGFNTNWFKIGKWNEPNQKIQNRFWFRVWQTGILLHHSFYEISTRSVQASFALAVIICTYNSCIDNNQQPVVDLEDRDEDV